MTNQRSDFDETVGIVGLGNMGLPIALNIIQAGFNVRVLDLRDEPVERCGDAGATVAGGPKDLAESCSIIQIIVDSDEAVRSLLLNEEGIIEAADPETLIVIHSTVPPKLLQEITEEAADREIGLIDVPVSGGDVNAEAGTLSLIAGGEEHMIERCRPLFDVIGKNVFHVGDLGSGQVTKLANNVMAHGNHMVALEAMKLAEAYGVDERSVVEVANASTGGSWMTENWGFYDRYLKEHTQAGSDELYFFLRHTDKDALAAAAEKNVGLPIVGMLSELRPIMLADRDQAISDEDAS